MTLAQLECITTWCRHKTVIVHLLIVRLLSNSWYFGVWVGAIFLVIFVAVLIFYEINMTIFFCFSLNIKNIKYRKFPNINFHDNTIIWGWKFTKTLYKNEVFWLSSESLMKEVQTLTNFKNPDQEIAKTTQR